MPDESNAASEHALLQEITAPLSTLPDDSLPAVAEVDFPIVLRGYDRLAVDAYVRRTSQLVAELQSTRSPEAAVRRGLERVGEEVSGILQRAHEAASQIAAQSRSDAEDRLERARAEAAQITATAERRLQDLDAETDRIWAERQRIVEDAQQLARELLSLAHAAAARFPAADDPETTQEGSARPFGVSRLGREVSEVGEASDSDAPDAELDAGNAELDAGEVDTLEGPPDADRPGLVVDEPAEVTEEDAGDAGATRVMPPIPPPHDGESH